MNSKPTISVSGYGQRKYVIQHDFEARFGYNLPRVIIGEHVI